MLTFLQRASQHTAHTLYPPPPPDIELEMKPMSTWKAMSPKMTLPMFCCCSVRFGLGSLSTSDAPAFWQVNTQQVRLLQVRVARLLQWGRGS
jgi:hypothetical protein